MGIIRTGWPTYLGIRDRVSERVAASALVVLLLHWVVVISFILPRMGDLHFLRLHYTVALGVDWVGAWWKIFVFPGLGLLIFFINGAVSGIISRKQPRLGTVVHMATFFLELVLAVAGVIAVLLNS